MSIVSAYVALSDGTYARDPMIEGEGWFICFDDDDPPEIVIRRAKDLDCNARARELLEELGIPHRRLEPQRSRGRRMFGRAFAPAQSLFFELTGPLPHGLTMSHGGVVERPRGDAIVYGEGAPRE